MAAHAFALVDFTNDLLAENERLKEAVSTERTRVLAAIEAYGDDMVSLGRMTDTPVDPVQIRAAVAATRAALENTP